MNFGILIDILYDEENDYELDELHIVEKKMNMKNLIMISFLYDIYCVIF